MPGSSTRAPVEGAPLLVVGLGKTLDAVALGDRGDRGDRDTRAARVVL
jgi:hypothetical protein